MVSLLLSLDDGENPRQLLAEKLAGKSDALQLLRGHGLEVGVAERS
jgi:hypothetical protein